MELKIQILLTIKILEKGVNYIQTNKKDTKRRLMTLLSYPYF